MLTILTFLWKDKVLSDRVGFSYTPADIFLLRKMLERHLNVPHDYLCITDDEEQFRPGDGIRTAKLNRHVSVPDRIYEPLYAFSPDLKEHGDRFLKLDLDTVIVGDVAPLVERDEDLVMWRNPRLRGWVNADDIPPFHKPPTMAWYNCSAYLYTPGKHAFLWDEFDESKIQQGWKGDQDWVSYRLGPDMPFWSERDGIYRLAPRAPHRQPGHSNWGAWGDLPENAKIVFFPGGRKPWVKEIAEANPWISRHRY